MLLQKTCSCLKEEIGRTKKRYERFCWTWRGWEWSRFYVDWFYCSSSDQLNFWFYEELLSHLQAWSETTNKSSFLPIARLVFKLAIFSLLFHSTNLNSVFHLQYVQRMFSRLWHSRRCTFISRIFKSLFNLDTMLLRFASIEILNTNDVPHSLQRWSLFPVWKTFYKSFKEKRPFRVYRPLPNILQIEGIRVYRKFLFLTSLEKWMFSAEQLIDHHSLYFPSFCVSQTSLILGNKGTVTCIMMQLTRSSFDFGRD